MFGAAASKPDLSRDCAHVILFLSRLRPRPQSQDRLTGGKGLNMNYSIIFTEINFYPETSILFQIITNNSYESSDEPRIQQTRVGSLLVLAPRRLTQ